MDVSLNEITVLVIGDYVPQYLDNIDREYRITRITEEIKNDIKSHLGYWLISNKLNIFPIQSDISHINMSWKIITLGCGHPVDEETLDNLKDFDKYCWVYTQLPKNLRDRPKKSCNITLNELERYLQDNKFSSNNPGFIIAFIDYKNKHERKMLRKIIKLKNKLKIKLFLHGVTGNAVSGNLT